ncbi:amidohydrolase family protein [Sphaerotilus mobilis]|uniref:Putative TIM-barrel fold metal-dependent hydrolase n=1 Tax=Sphaerotilus mobilis TaxID=47994 RepID=A0A4Q7LQH6_9BURK|nr:amidohydrolase family protein [Sphaerotilus mobilis]RZS56904.1 putative TIM-barrel fold metal-dependent hydrolase [Sphaerotilus mobilis]
MNIFDEPKIDCHNHVLDPVRHPYAADVAYRPAGQEIGTLAQHRLVMDSYGIRHALVVGPNSGYGLDNRCLLDTLAASGGRYKGIAVVRNDTSREELQRLQQAGVVGVAFNATIHGVDHYLDSAPMLRHLADLGLFIQAQVTDDQMVGLAPLLLDSGARILIDHAGRPVPSRGLQQPGFQAVLDLARSGRAVVKLSGHQKYSAGPWPYDDAEPHVRALVDAYGLDACVWASDWPFLRAGERLDMGPLLRLVERWWPDPADRRRLLWDTPRRLFQFGQAG